MRSDKANALLNLIEKDSRIQNYIAQANSRYILHTVKEPQANFPRFAQGLDDRLLSIAYSYLSIACTLAEKQALAGAIYPFEKGASILEYIYNHEQNKTAYSSYYKLTSALAHYAAFQYSKAFIVLRNSEFESKTAKLISNLLKKDFSALLREINSVLLNPDYNDRVIAALEDEAEAQHKVYTAFVARALAALIEFIYSGKTEWLEQTHSILDDLLELVGINEDPAMWWLVRILRIIINGYEIASPWKALPINFGGNYNELLDLYIRNLAFGKPSIVELFVSQREALKKVLEPDGAVIGLPTSSGKTRIAEIAILQCLMQNRGAIVLYLAPFRSLAFEIEESLSSTFTPLGFEVSHLYGGSQFSTVDKELAEESNIIIATPEKAKAILRADSEIANKVKLVVIDEGHLLGYSQREILNELFVEELKLFSKRNEGKIILLSAVLPNTKDISKWITNSENKIVESSWRPSSQRFGILQWNGRNLDIEWKSKEEPVPFNRDFIKPFVSKAPKPKVIFPINKKQAIAATAIKMSQVGSVLIFVGRKNMIMTQAKEVLTAMGNNPEIINWINPDDWELFTLACNEAFGNHSPVLKYAMYGIICHSRDIPNDVRYAMERLMRKGNPKIIISTSTLAQGVNIGVSTVIIANVYISTTPINSTDFWNIAGRAGRAFVDSEGKILYVIDNTQEDWKVKKARKLSEAYFDSTVLEDANSGLLHLVNYIYKISEECDINSQLLLELIAENDYSKFKTEYEDYSEIVINNFDWIDDTLLSLNVELESYNMEDPSDWIDDFFRRSLAVIQSKNENKVLDFLKARNKGVIKMAGNPARWKSYVSSGIPLRSSVMIEGKIKDIISILLKYNESTQTLEDLVIFLMDVELIVSDFPSQHFKARFEKGAIDDSRGLWLSGAPLHEIQEKVDNAQDICNEHFGFGLPWAINAISRKLYDMEYTEEAEQYAELALLTELGLPNFKAAKIYLTGIRSRSASSELSRIITFEKGISLKALREFLIENIASLRKRCGSEAIKWIESLNTKKTNGSKETISRINLSHTIKDKSVTTVTFRSYNNQVFLCSLDYKYQEKVNVAKTGFKSHVDNLGITYELSGDYENTWEMSIRNPRLIIDE